MCSFIYFQSYFYQSIGKIYPLLSHIFWKSMLYPGPCSLEPIGLGKEINGLYLLKRGDSTSTSSCFSSFISVSINKTQPYIWHARLRHLSNAKLALMNKNNVFLINSNEKFHCDICPLAKQKRLPFNTSSHISNECFDLIYCDLWGLFSVSTIDGFRFFLTIVDDCSKCT